MPVVRYVHPTLGQYTTIQAAYDAAAAGDTVLVHPSNTSYVSSWNKRVHLKGETTDPINDPVQICGADFYLQGLAGAGGDTSDVWFEGIKMYGGGGSGNSIAVGNANWLNGPTLHFNRCLIGDSYYTVLSGGGSNCAGKLKFHNCSIGYPDRYGGAGRAWADFAAGSLVLYACTTTPHDTNNAEFKNQCAYWDCVNVATDGYGAGYGEWYYDQWQGAAYSIAGAVSTPSGVLPSSVQILLYKRTAGGLMDPLPYAQTYADPVTGHYEFKYLPTNQRFYVAWVPPEGLKPGLKGIYTPHGA
jgi:hypothetical protein